MLACVLSFFLVAGPQPASALTKAVDDWILSGQTVIVNSQSFTVYLSSRTNEIVADYGSGSLFVKNNSCEQTMTARLCLDNVQYDFTDKVTKVRVRAFSLAPVLTTTREVSRTEFVVGDEIAFTVTIKNAGGFARNVTFQELFPSGFEVTATEGLLLQPGMAVWRGNIDQDGTASFTYKAKANSTFEGSMVASLTYFDGLRYKTSYTSTLTLKATSAMVLLTPVGSSSILIGQRNNVTINLTNKLPETALVEVDVVFDEGLRVVSRPYGVKNSSLASFHWSGEISKTNRTMNLSKALFFEFRGARVGSSDIRTTARYRPESTGVMQALPEGKQSVAVSDKGVIVRTSLKDSTLEANQGSRLKVWVQNLNPYAQIREVIANVSTRIVTLPDSYLAGMAAQEQALIVDKSFYAPPVDKSTGYVVSVNVTYLTEFGDNASKNFLDTVTVIPVELVTVTQTVVSKLAAGDEAEVVVAVRNPRMTSLRGVKVFDNLSSEFTAVGRTFATVDIASKGTVEAYRYRVKVPHIGSAKTLHINTTMRYDDKYNSERYAEPKEHVFSKSTTILVEPESLPLAIARTVDDEATYLGELFDVKYVITNTASDREARNIRLNIPLIPGIDLVDSEETVEVGRLNPGETIAVTGVERRRAKAAGDFELPAAFITYENAYGGMYRVNSSLSTLAVKDNYVKGPLVFVEQNAPETANNTDDILVKLTVRNAGNEPAIVSLFDEGRETRITVLNMSSYVANRTVRYAAQGKAQLPMARIQYAYGGMTMLSISRPRTIEILNNPVVSVDKIVPASVNSLEPFTVLLVVRNKVPETISDVSVADAGRSWVIDFLPPLGQANVSYEESTSVAGRQVLGSAAATYSYEGSLYTAESSVPSINVEEKQVVSISKAVAPENATRDDGVSVKITVANLFSEALEMSVLDGGKTFSGRFGPGEEKTFSYETSADNSTGLGASVSYTFKGRQLTTISRLPSFTLAEPGHDLMRNPESESGKKGFIGRMLSGLLSILTWKRGG